MCEHERVKTKVKNEDYARRTLLCGLAALMSSPLGFVDVPSRIG